MPLRFECLLLAAITTMVGTGFPSQAQAQFKNISVEWLTGALYLVEDPNFVSTNSLIYVGPKHVTVVGASWSPDTARELAKTISKVTPLPIGEVIDTSPDPEWSGGNAYWRSIGAEIVTAQVTCDALARTWKATVKDIQSHLPTYPSLPSVAPTRCYPDRFSLQAGKVRVFYLGPSHTSADLFVYFPDEQVLDAGSILKPFLGNLAKADVREYPITLGKLKSLRLSIRMIVAGHWSAVHGPDLVDRYLDLLAKARS
jgi:metallo-beta-lactamase class B